MDKREKIKIIKEDFLKRNGKDFTNQKKEGRLNWEALVGEGESYSSRLATIRTEQDLYKTAYDHAKDMIVAMNCPFKVKIKISDNSSYTDSKVVAIATDYFDNRELSVGRKLDIFTGLAIHEACHLRYTDFSINKKSNRIVHSLMNVIEDERIENKLGQDKPGLIPFLSSVKYFYFANHQDRTEKEKADSITRLFNAILSMIRYPKAIDMNDAEEFADELLQVRDILMPFASSTEMAYRQAEKIYDIIKKYIDDNNNENPDNSGSEGDDSDESDNNESSGSKGKGGKQKQTDEEIEKRLGKIIDSLEKECIGNSNEPIKKSKYIQYHNREAKVIQGEFEIGKNGNVNVHYAEDNKELYNDTLCKVKQYIPAIKSVLRNNGADRVFKEKGLKTGRLDTNKLVAARIGCDNIYTKSRLSRADNIAVCILIDESGSMEGDKIFAARQTAVLLKEAINNVPNVELFMYGHSTDGNYALLDVFIEPGNKKTNKYSVGDISAKRCNVDSIAIKEAADRVRSRTQNKCLFFVISDGMPCEPIENVIKVVNSLSKQDFEFINIGIEMDIQAEKMYKNVIKLTDMSRLAPDLNKIIKNCILTNTKRK